MADRFSTEIKFGGPVTEAQLRQIASLAAQCNLSVNYEQNYEEEFIFKALVQQMADDYQHFELNDHDLYTDMEDDLTDYLQKQKIPYEIRVDARYEFDSELHWWRPGMKREDSWQMMDHEAKTVMISLPALEKALRYRTALKTVVKRLRNIPPPMDEGIIVESKSRTTTGSGKTIDSGKVKP